ncbi:Schlafen and ATP-dependent DNA helicase domains-containing protein [Desulfonema limicola]|uniref:Schlafen and ATP-dependent DNA helicase domains-containing protein n=1 Tax=Desulfonema limicola TaxID=45656 RepID=A0A975GGB3_9BACT|nr:RNA-binding domain-containing protein [Desulfonema limicola]QTA80084.1 Schlafen and ATP-dependent DNA helicase domains-containing protein [Desulfonema limicola]
MNIREKLYQPESRKLEFKSRIPAKMNDLLKTITAFANGAGGEIIIGVSDRERTIEGVSEPLQMEERIANAVHDGIMPMISPYISILNFNGKQVLIVQVLPGSQKPYYIKSMGIEKGVYIRIGSTTRQAAPEMIKELNRQSLGIAFEVETDFTKTPEHIDKEAVNQFFHQMGHPEPAYEILKKWSLLGKNNGDYYPTVAGLVLFGICDLPDYDFAGIRLTKFQGNTMTNISETREYSIPILPKMETICRHTADFLQKESYLEGIRRLERTIIPFYALREAIVNAVVHRDYSIRGSGIKINVFDNRMEVISPGILYGNMDISDLGTGLSECRNRAMVRIFRRMGMMEELGTGIARIYELFLNRNLMTPLFFEQGQFFKAVLPQESQEKPGLIKEYLNSESR